MSRKGLLVGFRLGIGLWLGLLPGLGQAQPAVLIPNAEQTFVDPNGAALGGGSVCFYIPNTLTPKQTWQDTAETIPNTTPCVVLNSAGRAIIYGSGTYRQQVFDLNGNLQWDQLTFGSTVIPAPPIGTTYSALFETVLGTYEWLTGIETVQTISSLRAQSAPWPTVHVQGASITGDGGGGDFELVSGSCVDNAGTVVRNSGGLCYQRTEAKAGTVKAQWFLGADIGAKVNAAFASFPLVNNLPSCGRVELPAIGGAAGTYATNIVIPPGLNAAQCSLWGQGPGSINTTLTFTGTGDGIESLQSGESGLPPIASGELAYFTLVGAGSATNCANGIHIGDQLGFWMQQVEVDGFAGTTAGGCAAPSAGIWFDNAIVGGHTEGYDSTVTVSNNTDDIRFTNTTGDGSFEHGDLHVYAVAELTGEHVISVEDMSDLARMRVYVNGNLAHNGSIFYVDASSVLNNVWVYDGMENTDQLGAFFVTVASGGSCGLVGYFYADPNLSVSGACTLGGAPHATWVPVDQSGAGLSLTINTAVMLYGTTQAQAILSVTYPVTVSSAAAVIGGLPLGNPIATQIGCAIAQTTYTSQIFAGVGTGPNSQRIVFTNSSGNITNSDLSGLTVELNCLYPVE